ncbi:type II toxin-antitoxin system VapB family antitoxin [Nitratireductor mangrovi]|uniref:Type II toxin-antitoxin system VapB family antitoxin n=2 Tax=Nitratireductor mangrovi TaxID=2599600 RepID=A0A5B8KUC4_9HYPH|nr:type II toxin-antitoxin system VapB family antitoxin [Nitratireductor mangrovi]
MVRQLAHKRGIGITAAIREAVGEALVAEEARSRIKARGRLAERVKPLLDRLDRLPRAQTATDKAFYDDLWDEGT